MAVNARLLFLRVRAARSTELSFAVPGVIESVGPQGELGAKVTAYAPRPDLYSRLGETEIDPAGRPTGRLVFGSERIRAELLPKALMVLANESQAAELDQAILARQNEYLTHYRHIAEMESEFRDGYRDKLDRLGRLKELVDRHYAEIESAYHAESQSLENPAHAAAMRPTTVATVKLAAVGTIERGQIQDWDGDGAPGHGIYYTHKIEQAARPARLASTGAWEEYGDADPAPKLVSQQITSIVQSDHIAHPRLENQMRHERLGVDVIDELLAERTFAKRIPYLREIWRNELEAIDLSVRKLQLAYIDTFLLSPINGMVTAVYRQPGEGARSSDAVVRVDDASRIILSGQVQSASPIVVGQTVKVKAKRAFGASTSPSPELTGKVILARGSDSDVGRWTVAFAVEPGNALPLDYTLEPDPTYTTITIG
jgi:hypothetical protein